MFTAPSDQIPPIDTASGAGQGVRAYVFACHDCNDANDRFVGWLEMYTPEAKAILAAPAEEDPDKAAQREMQMFEVWEKGQLIRAADGDQWVGANTQEAVTITSAIERKCPAGVPKPCLPGRL